MNAVRALLAILLSVGCNTVYGFQGFHRDVLNLPNVTDFQVTSQAVSTSSLAWTSDDVIKSPLTSLTMCVWAKSTNLKQTGTIVAYTIDNRVEFALLAFKSPSASDTSNYDVYLVVSGRRMSRSVQLRMDDVRWHHVCVTWEAEGIFRAFMDQTLIEEMNDLPVAEILPGGRFYFGTTLKTNNTSQENVVPFVGKLTGFSLWNTSLDFAAIRALGDCNAFNEKQLLGRDIQNTTAVLTTGSRANLIYEWSPGVMTYSWPASFYPNEDVCGNEVTVDCGHRHMLISLSSARPMSLDIPRSELHLDDVACVPTARGREGEHYVFELRDFASCGTTRTVSDTEVIYTNHVSNMNREASVVFIGYTYSSQIRCHYPIDLTVTMRRLSTGAKEGLVASASMRNPTTNQSDLEAMVVLFKDEAFSRTFENTPLLRPLDSIYVGVVVKTNNPSRSTNDVNVVVDTCWVTSHRYRKKIISNNGCTIMYNGVTMLDNGRNSQARIKLSAEVFSFSSNSLYIQCSVYPCIGHDCSPDCSSNRTASFNLPGQTVTSLLHTVQKRAVQNTETSHYDLTVGPVYSKGFWTHRLVQQNQGFPSIAPQEDTFYKNPVFLATIATLCCLAVFSLLLAIALLRKRRRASLAGNDEIPVQITQHKRRQSSEGSSSSISSVLSISMSSFDSFSSFDSIEFSASHH